MLLRLSQATGELGEAPFFGFYITFIQIFFHLKKGKESLLSPQFAFQMSHFQLNANLSFLEMSFFVFLLLFLFTWHLCTVIVLNLFCWIYKASLPLHLFYSLLSPTLTLSLFFPAMLSPFIYEVLYASHPHLCSCLQVHPIVSLSFIKPFCLCTISTLTSLFLS